MDVKHRTAAAPDQFDFQTESQMAEQAHSEDVGKL